MRSTDARQGVTGCAAVALLWAVLTATALAEDAASDAAYTDRGADSCLRCHDESSEVPILDIFKTRHGHRGDPDAPFGEGLQCEACHGPGADHAKRVRRGQERPPIAFFSPSNPGDAEAENAICLDCHQDVQLDGWRGSDHDDRGVRCTDCHKLHTTDDAVTRTALQPPVCYTCHQQQRADANKASVHPIRYGQMACSDCHTPHGSNNPHGLIAATVNDTCYGCHEEKRGPFLWEHAPASEDCGYCHRPHGSNHPALLERRSPLLCQSCHSRSGHPSLALTAEDLPGRGSNLSAFLLARGCQNCHAQVHGSNHPSGTNLTR